MKESENAFLRHQQQRWLRPDAGRWLRPDVARYLKPGSDVASLYPLPECKYNPNQPRVPAGNAGGGQWTGGGSGSVGGADAATSPMRTIDFGDLPSFSDLFSLFQIAPSTFDNSDFAHLAGDVADADEPGIGHNQGPPLEPSEIPQQRPESPAGRMKIVWSIARWVGRVGRFAPAVDIFFGAKDEIEWLKSYDPAMKSYSDPPKRWMSFTAGLVRRASRAMKITILKSARC